MPTPNDLLDISENRFVLHPIKFPEIFEMGKKAIASFWQVEELDFNNDVAEFNRMDADEKHFVLQILAFFASADGIVIENLVENFCGEVQLPEARYFYSYQAFNEQIHSETYARLLQVYAGDNVHDLLKEAQASPPVRAKTEFAKKHFDIVEPDPHKSFAKRLIAFACVEGINFSASFCGIYWLSSRNFECRALTFSNEFIARDEGLHRDFAVKLYKTFMNNLTHEEITQIVKESVQVEEVWVRHALPQPLTGMNQELMIQYVRFTADGLLMALGVPAYYKVENPFPFMDAISVGSKTNFFERRVSEYALSSNNEQFNMDADF
tara:strand:- start:333 stop:1301 length:969 start_codon:yes stop_codon:yes gene_type:complete